MEKEDIFIKIEKELDINAKNETEILKSKLSEMMENEDYLMELMDRIYDFVDKLKVQFGNEINSYRFYHLLTGSGSFEGIPDTKEDFEGQFSVKNFIEKEYEQYLKRKQ